MVSKDDREFFTMDELVKEFSLDGVSKSGAVFDKKKLTWMNHMYLGRKPAADLLTILREDFPEQVAASFDGVEERLILRAIELTKGQRTGCPDLFRLTANIVHSEVTIADDASRAIAVSPEAQLVLAYLVEHADDIPFGQDEATVSAWVEDLRNHIPLAPRKLYAPIRVALFGAKDGPEIVKLFMALDPQIIRSRLSQALAAANR